MKKRGFTLGEVLITLGIVGVCSVMLINTVKSVSVDVQGTKAEVMSNKVVTNFSGVTKQILMLHSTTKKMSGLKKLNSTSACKDAKCLFDLYGKYLQITQKLTASDVVNAAGLPGEIYGRLNDGTIFGLSFSDSCNKSGTINGKTYSNICGIINYDVNANELPNMQGKDRFTMYLFKTGVKTPSVTAE